MKNILLLLLVTVLMSACCPPKKTYVIELQYCGSKQNRIIDVLATKRPHIEVSTSRDGNPSLIIKTCNKSTSYPNVCGVKFLSEEDGDTTEKNGFVDEVEGTEEVPEVTEVEEVEDDGYDTDIFDDPNAPNDSYDFENYD